MNALWTAYLFHIKEQIRTKGFRITSIVISILILGYFAYNHFSSNEEKVLVTVINTSKYYSLDDKLLKENIEGLQLHSEQIKNEEKEQQKIKDQDLDHLIVIKEQDSVPVVNYYYHRSPDPTVMFAFTTQLQQQYLSKVSTEHALSQEVVTELFQNIPVEETMLAENNGSLGIVYVFIFLMYTFIIMFGQGVAMSITGEKSTRVMEVMITKIKPIYMLFAKILSSLTAGLIQVSVFLLSGYLAYLIGWINKDLFSIFGFGLDLSQVNAGLIIGFIFFFACGYLVYALCFAALGSVISRTEDLGSVMGPVMVLVVGALMVGIKTMMDPTGGLVTFSTYFPFFSPIVAYSKFVMGEISTLELLISGAVLIISIGLLAYAASRIYVKGVMVYGEKFKWSQLTAMLKK
ncbi:ABC transporter permease [Neobacillus niacini]|uniref:ABC transporter permease n=1 Tax=Neobacillus niacini TaxID=86668 RepID=UPI001C8E1C9C|nr:ABC transporter permease [Neobacillus niacini]MBY0148043.1 ABC transporter permease [Neobacillus niacini]